MLQRITLTLSIAWFCACGPSSREDLFGDALDRQPDAPCPTAITGKVFAPNGTLPLYNVMVYVPETMPTAFPEGVQCSSCAMGIPGGAIAKTQTDAEGKFRLELPPGMNVPVIITTGKWRRRLTVPFVGQCVDNPIPDGMFRLPKNRSEGELPRIAAVTGGCDALACVLSKLGIDPSEFGSSSTGAQRVVFYNGQGGTAPGTPQASTALWGSLDELKKFDMVINSCECNEYATGKTTPDLLKQYADIGGRVFGSHYQYIWTRTLVPEWQSTATWSSGGTQTPDLVDTSHPNGEALAKWLVAVGASSIMGQLTLGEKIPNVSTVAATTTRWLYSSAATNPTTHYLSFNTPVGALPVNQCGKVVYAGMHVASGSVNTSFPTGCNSTFSPDEKALVFLLFDLGSCVDIIF